MLQWVSKGRFNDSAKAIFLALTVSSSNWESSLNVPEPQQAAFLSSTSSIPKAWVRDWVDRYSSRQAPWATQPG